MAIERYWCPREGSLGLDKQGYLNDPTQKYGEHYNPHIRTFGQIAAVPCLILLGEPGIGKSTALKEAKPLANQLLKPGDSLLWRDLREFSSEDRLYRSLFESPEWTGWLAGSNELHLVLDSLDEVRIRISNVTQMLAAAFENAPSKRLRMWISCRTADWPYSFEERLIKVWGESAVRAYELAPLRFADVKAIATESGIDADRFVAQVDERGVGTFAARPVTLKLLTRLFKSSGALPISRDEIYAHGCLSLVSEPDPERRDNAKVDPHAKPALSPEGRLCVASRLAAMMLLTNRTTIFAGAKLESLPGEDILPSEVAGGSESDGANEFQLDAAQVEEVLRTGLFTARAAQRLGWAHQTYAEYLAARYLATTPLVQLKSLLVHPLDGQGRIVPQLHQLASWIASRRDDLFQYVCSVEPSVLLRSDMSLLEASAKEKIVKGLLDLLVQGKVILDLESNDDFSGLSHPRLPEQLLAVIGNKGAPAQARLTAIDIAESCKAVALVDALLGIALDATAVYRVRFNAALAVSRIGDSAAKRRLLPLAKGEAGEDADDDLRGVALRALWPAALVSIEELLPCLIEPKNKDLIGFYSTFLNSEFVRSIQQAQLPAVLACLPRWLNPQRSRLNSAAVAIIGKAALHLNDPEVRRLLSAAIVVRINQHHSPFEDIRDGVLNLDVAGRRALVRELINGTDLGEFGSVQLFMGTNPLLKREDGTWALEEVRSAPAARLSIWLKVIDTFSGFAEDAAFCDGLIRLIGDMPAAAEKFSWVRPWPLDDQASRHAKADYLKQKRWEKRRDRPEPAEAETDVATREQLLAKFETTGAVGSWIRFCFALTQSGQEYDPFCGNITESVGWKAISERARGRARAAAKKYILEHSPEENKWLHTNEYPHIVLAGYQAFRMLLDDEEFLGGLGPTSWEKWTPILVNFPVNSDDSILPKIVAVAAKHSPNTVLHAFESLVDAELKADHQLFIKWRFEQCWDRRFEDILLAKARSPELLAKDLDPILTLLLEKENSEAADFLVGLLSNGAEAEDRLAVGVSAGLKNGLRAAWPHIAALMVAKPEAAKAGIIHLAGRLDSDKQNFVKVLGPAAAADFFLWLHKEYPPKPREPGVSWVSARDRIEEIRNGILRQLVDIGSFEAVQEIARLAASLPDSKGLSWSLEKVRTNALRAEWQPASLPALLNLLQHPKRRLVENAQQLQELIVESLERLQAELQGETPSASELWNYQGSGNQRHSFKPKDEEDLSEKIARWLKADLGPNSGLIVNREVQPRRNQRTDIYVSASPLDTSGAHSTLTVVVEVKGCWNQEINTALKTQLVDKYLIPNGHQCGIFIVGCFNCAKWEDEDRKRRSDKQGKDMPALNRLLTEQASNVAKENPALSVAVKLLDLRLDK